MIEYLIETVGPAGSAAIFCGAAFLTGVGLAVVDYIHEKRAYKIGFDDGVNQRRHEELLNPVTKAKDLSSKV